MVREGLHHRYTTDNTNRTSFDTSRHTVQPDTPQSERLPRFAERAMQQIVNKDDVLQVKSDGKGKFEFLKGDGTQARAPMDLNDLKTSDPVRYHQIQHDIMKQGIAQITGVGDLEKLHNVQKIDGVYRYHYDYRDGYKEHKLPPEDFSKRNQEAIEDQIHQMEEAMRKLGFTTKDKFMSKHLEKAVLEEAVVESKKSAGDWEMINANGVGNEDDIKNGTVYDYDKEGKKWYILKQSGEIEEFLLNTTKIQQDAKKYSIQENLKIKNGEDIVDVKFLDGKMDQYEIRGADPNHWEMIYDKKLDTSVVAKINRESDLRDIAFNENDLGHRTYRSDLGEKDDLLIEKKDALTAYRARMKWAIRFLQGLSFLNTGAEQAAINVNATVEQLFKMGGNPNQLQGLATTKGSEAVINYLDKYYQNNKKFMRREIALIERFKEEDLPVRLHGLEHTFRGIFNQDGSINEEGKEKWGIALNEHLKKIDDDKLWQ